MKALAPLPEDAGPDLRRLHEAATVAAEDEGRLIWRVRQVGRRARRARAAYIAELERGAQYTIDDLLQ